MHRMIRFMSAAAVFFLSAAAVMGQTVKAGPDGVYQQDGKPIFLLGGAIEFYWTDLFTANSGCPPEYRYIYEEIPNRRNMERLGFNTMGIFILPTALRTLAEDYRGYGTYSNGSLWSDFQKISNQIGCPWMATEAFRQNTERQYALIRNLDMPIYMDACAYYYIHCLFSQKDKGTAFLRDKQAFVDPKGLRDFYLLYLSLVTKEGRETYFKLWRYAAEEMKANGGRTLCYELFNEPKYTDYSPAARDAFLAWLNVKYGNIASLNQVWHTNYQNFADVVDFGTEKECAGLAVDWGKFSESLVVNICAEGRKEIQKIDREAHVAVQQNGGDWLLTTKVNFNYYDISQHMDIINTGTGGSEFTTDEGKPEDSPLLDNANLPYRLRSSIFAAKLSKALADGKPIISNEAYPGNTYQSMFGTIWTEMIRGRNATYFHGWQHNNKGSKEDAEKFPFFILNLYAFNPHDLKAIKDAQEEIKTVGDFFLPRANRVKAEAAILFSFPTERYEVSGAVKPVSREIYTSSMALEFSLYPNDAIYEEQLAKKSANYKIIFANGVRNTYPATPDLLSAYVNKGGILVALLEPMKFDEYGNLQRQQLFDLKLEDEGTTPLTGRLDRLGARAIRYKKIGSTKGWETVDSIKGVPVIVRKRYGSGWMYFIAARFSDYGLGAVYRRILSLHQIAPMARLLKQTGDELTANVEMHKAVSDGMTAWYLMNADHFPKIVRLQAPELDKKLTVDLFRKQRLPMQDGTVTILLPPQQRTVLITGDPAAIARRFGDFAPVTLTELAAAKEKIVSAMATAAPVAGKTIDLRPFCNKGYDNAQNYLTKSALFDGEVRDLTGFPWSSSVLNGCPVDLLRFDYHYNKDCIALTSAAVPDGAAKVANIPVNGNAQAISFFHTVTCGNDGVTVMRYVVRYADGSQATLPVKVGENIGDWKISANTEQAKKLLAWKNSFDRGFFRWQWTNPYPEKEIAALDIVVEDPAGKATPVIFAITVHEPGDAPVAAATRVEFPVNWKFDGRGSQAVRTGSADFVIKEARGGMIWMSPDQKPLPIPPTVLDKAYLCFSVNSEADEWGNGIALSPLYLEVFGIKDNREAKGKIGWLDVYSWAESKLKNKKYDSDLKTWQPMRVPLSLMLPTGKDRFDNITKITIFRSDMEKVKLLIRDLHIEYEK